MQNHLKNADGNDEYSVVENCCKAYKLNKKQLNNRQTAAAMQSSYQFIQYMGSKPNKFGIKFWFLVDIESKFPYLSLLQSTALSGDIHVLYILLLLSAM